jgi:PhnB protein
MKIHELFAYLCVDNSENAIAFYKKAFGAQEKFRLTEPSGRIGHAELDFGGATIMLSDEFPEYGIRGPRAIGGTAVTIHLHVDDADEFIGRAVAAGAEVEREPTDAFYGERSGCIRDPFGHRWNIGHSIEEVSTEEMQRRYTEMSQGSDAGIPHETESRM